MFFFQIIIVFFSFLFSFCLLFLFVCFNSLKINQSLINFFYVLIKSLDFSSHSCNFLHNVGMKLPGHHSNL